MDIRSIFSKKRKKCAVCGLSSDEKLLVGYDPTNRGQFDGETSVLCIDHFKDRYLHGVKNSKTKVVAFLPDKHYESYSFGEIETVKDWGIEPDVWSKLNSYLGSSFDGCKKCGSAARINLIPKAYNDVITFDLGYSDTTKLDREEKTPLCDEHFVEEIVDFIKKNKIQLDEVNLPHGQSGIYIHGEK